MKKLLFTALFLGSSTLLSAQKATKTPAVYKPVRTEMYKKGWIDLNKNGIKDVYEADCHNRRTYRRPAQPNDTGRKNMSDGDALWIQKSIKG